jgi:hypothetical protein
MRTLSTIEAEQTTGGFSVFGITEIETGLKLMTQVRAVAGHAAWAFTTGAAVGTAIYYGYGFATGSTLGGDIYELFHC